MAACQRVAFLTCLHYPEPFSESSSADAARNHSRDDAASPTSWERYANAILHPCPWLPSHSKSGKPAFLWDIKEKKTVRFHGDEERPVYTIISHTWGRWRIPQTQPNSNMSIRGVPWLVPRNTRFDIETLPDIFYAQRSVYWPAEYL